MRRSGMPERDWESFLTAKHAEPLLWRIAEARRLYRIYLLQTGRERLRQWREASCRDGPNPGIGSRARRGCAAAVRKI